MNEQSPKTIAYLRVSTIDQDIGYHPDFCDIHAKELEPH